MSRWVDLTEIAERLNLSVKEEGKNFPMGEGEVKKLEGLVTRRMCIRLVLLPSESVGTAKLFMDIVASNWKP